MHTPPLNLAMLCASRGKPCCKALVIMALFVIATPVSGINIVVNGDFEDPVVSGTEYGAQGKWDVYFAGETIPGWTVGGHSIDVVGKLGWQAASGDQSVDLNGYGFGSISQVLNTIPGHDYKLSFAMSANSFDGYAYYVAMEFLWQDQLVGSLGFYWTPATVGWNYHEYTLNTPTDQTRLTFQSTGGRPNAGAALDDVQVCDLSAATVPDGPVGSLALLPLGALLWLGRTSAAGTPRVPVRHQTLTPSAPCKTSLAT
ncbi:MAG: DUF642 domain-containing protein [Limisphaerales bacterium]